MLRFLMIFLIPATPFMFLLAGCDESTVDPGPMTGTVSVACIPDTLPAPWILSGPDGLSFPGHGDSLINDLLVGEYTLIWGNLDQWIPPTPVSESRILAAETRLDFQGIYTKIVILDGTIRIDSAPDSLEISWVLNGVSDFTLAGAGDSLLSDMPPGQYTLIWGEVGGWLSPIPVSESRILASNRVLEFNGLYTWIAPQTGTVVIDCTPDTLATPWSLYIGTELIAEGDHDSTLVEMDSALYWLFWGDIPGWNKPDSQSGSSRILPVDGEIVFTGEFVFVPQTGSIFINCEPDALNIPWTLEMPDKSTVSGIGDNTFNALGYGLYTITWADIPGWITPTPSPQTILVSSDVMVVLQGVYQEFSNASGTIVVNPNPNGLSAPWELREPGHIKRRGNGDLTLDNMSPGEYTLVWEYVANHVTPAAQTVILADEQTISFDAFYIYTDYGQDYKLIPGSLFWMGSPENEIGRADDELKHQVTLTYNFWIRPTEVSCREYLELLQWAYDRNLVTVIDSKVIDLIDGSMSDLVDLDDIGSVISFSGGIFSCVDPDRPMVEVTWFGAAAYCDWLNMKENFPRSYNHSFWGPVGPSVYTLPGYRLPTEAEWEFACGVGSLDPFNTGACLDAATQANYDGTNPYAGCEAGPYLGRTRDVGSYAPNYWGLFDLHGNVWEWCWDDYRAYSQYPTINPVSLGSGPERVIRGGGFNDKAVDCRSSVRRHIDRNSAYSYLGFRYVRTN